MQGLEWVLLSKQRAFPGMRVQIAPKLCYTICKAWGKMKVQDPLFKILLRISR